MMQTDKKVLDATCSCRGMWFNKENPLALYVDRRDEHFEENYPSGKKSITVKPDIIADFTDLPFDDNTFYHVVFDPPHSIILSDKACVTKRYGRLPSDRWEEVLRRGFEECMRVLKPNGTLIFKWCEIEIPVSKVIQVIGYEPLYGHHSGKKSKTHWMAFLKTEAEHDQS